MLSELSDQDSILEVIPLDIHALAEAVNSMCTQIILGGIVQTGGTDRLEEQQLVDIQVLRFPTNERPFLTVRDLYLIADFEF